MDNIKIPKPGEIVDLDSTKIRQQLTMVIIELRKYANRAGLTECMRSRIEDEVSSLEKLNTILITYSKSMEVLRLESKIRQLKEEIDNEQL